MKCSHVIQSYPIKIREKLINIFSSPKYRGVIYKNDVDELIELFGISEEALMLEMLNIAKQYAHTPISNFQVGAIAKGLSGNLYFGANQEFLKEALTFTMHAEQGAITNAITHDERKITLLASSYVPCCLCRQFMLELEDAKNLKIILPNMTCNLLDLVPYPFGPEDLGINVRLMHKVDNGLPNTINYDPLEFAALLAASQSYSPYSKSYSGVAILTNDGQIFTGRYAENAAFNISTNPMMAALSNLNMSDLGFTDIKKAIITEPKDNIVSHLNSASNLLYSANPLVTLRKNLLGQMVLGNLHEN